MTDLLDPKFANLPTPTPKRAIFRQAKQAVRRMVFPMLGPLYWRPAKPDRRAKILLIRPDHLGDLLFLTPAIRYLRSLLPEAHLSLMLGPWGQTVYDDNPHLNELLICDFPGFTRGPKPAPWQPYTYLREQANRLREHQFDLAVILRFDHWWGAWLAAAAGIPRRFGYARPEVAPFVTHALPYDPTRHEVEQNWRLIHHAWSLGTLNIIPNWGDPEVMGGLEFFVDKGARGWAEDWLHRHNISDEKRLVVIHPGAGSPVKLWRPEAWAELAQTLIDQHQCQIIFTGSAEEVPLCREIAARITPTPPIAAGETSLAQLAALMGEATLALGPDTGPLKLAAAVGTPTVELYGPVDAGKFGPWPDRTCQRYITSGLSCIACNTLDYKPGQLAEHYCVRGLSVGWVLHEVVDLLKQIG